MKPFLRVIFSLALFIAAWEGVSRSAWVSPALFPPPSRVLFALREWAASGELVRDLAGSLWRAYLGLIIGLVAGILVGLFAGRLAAVRNYTLPVILLFRPIPPVSIIPLVIVWLGIGNFSKVMATAFAVFFPVFTATYQGARNLPDSYLWGARSVGLSWLAILFRIVLPGTMNVSLAGIRVAIAMAFVMVYVTELAGSSDGLGYQISVMHLSYRIDRMMAAMAVLAGCAAITDLVVVRTVSSLCPWIGKQAT